MMALVKYKVSIQVFSVLNHLWMRTKGMTHRIFMEGTVKGEEYQWVRYFNNRENTLQEMIKSGCRVFKDIEQRRRVL